MTSDGCPTKLSRLPLPTGIHSRFVNTYPFSLKFHILEALPDNHSPGTRPPLILLLHGFPNLAYDWRFVMPGLAEAGYYVCAFDMRGFGRTHNADLTPLEPSSFTALAMVRDIIALIHALGYRAIHTLVGHDLGAFAAAIFTLARTDVVKSLVLMSNPFPGIPGVPGILFGESAPAQFRSFQPPLLYEISNQARNQDIHSALKSLDPPRKHYKWYNASINAPSEWNHPRGEHLRKFLRAYFHLKSAEYQGNNPKTLESWTANSLSIMPYYYIMRSDLSMPGNVELAMLGESPDVLASLADTPWLRESDLDIYVNEWSRTRFTDALRWYRVLIEPELSSELGFLASKKLQVPTKYVSGVKDWGTYQDPGALEAMEQETSVARGFYKGTVLLEEAGHWVNVERPKECVREILDMAGKV